MMPAALAATLLVAVGIGRLALTSSSDDELVRAGSRARGGDAPVPGGRSHGREARCSSPGVRWKAPAAIGSRCSTHRARWRSRPRRPTRSIASDMARRLAPGDYQWWVSALVSPASRRSELRPLRLTK